MAGWARSAEPALGLDPRVPAIQATRTEFVATGSPGQPGDDGVAYLITLQALNFGPNLRLNSAGGIARMPVVPIILGGRELSIHKAFVHPSLGHRSVLTNSPWEYVSFGLKRKKEQKEALFYWEQGQRFYRAAEDLLLEAAPLLLYYSFMNAAKALLSAKKSRSMHTTGFKRRSPQALPLEYG